MFVTYQLKQHCVLVRGRVWRDLAVVPYARFHFCLLIVASPLASGGLGIAVLLVMVFFACFCLLFSAGHKFPGEAL